MSEILKYRLGNLIKSGKGIYRIYAMSVKEVLAIQYISEQIGSEKSVYSTLNTIYHDIPLTEEWLLKFGFERLFETGSTYSLGDFNVSDFGENGIFHYDVKQQIKYVHELQNLYFALTGSELVFSTEP